MAARSLRPIAAPLADGCGRHEAPPEMDLLDEAIGCHDDARAARRLDNRGIVTDAQRDARPGAGSRAERAMRSRRR